MKRRTATFLSALLLLLTAFSAYGASLSYQPDNVSITVEPDHSASFMLTVQMEATRKGIVFVTFKKQVTDAVDADWALDADWIETATLSSPMKLVGSIYSAETTVTVSVPEGTPSGTYKGYMISEGSGSLGTINGGEGVFLTVTVAGGCSSVPVFSNVSVGPETIWTPNNKDVEVVVSGMISMSEGCANKAVYEIIDEYGEKSVPETALDLNEDGSFEQPISVVALRKGKDKDGRLYTIVLSAANEAGAAEDVELYVRVGHDQRDSNGSSNRKVIASKKNVKKSK